jgi:YVTN family beta-propeller protein
MAGPKRPWLAAGGLLMLAAACGCGSTYRPVVAPINPVGPAPQPSALVSVLSLQNAPGQTPNPASAGVATILDFSGDSIVAQAYVGPGPSGFALSNDGGSGYTINNDNTLSTFGVSANLMTKNVAVTTLLPSTVPVNALAVSGAVYLADASRNEIDYLTGSPVAFKQSVSVGLGPITVVGNSAAQRVYAISQMVALDRNSGGTVVPGACTNPSAVSTPGNVYSIETATNTVSNVIPVGICPVYGVASPDNRRLFILNRGDGTVTVINSQTNQFDQTIKVGAGPVYAEILQTSSILVTANYDSSTVSFIDVSTDVYGNNSKTFGTELARVPVGKNPSYVAVMQDGSRAYTANEGDGTVSVIDMTSFKVKKTIPVMSQPRSVTSVSNSLIGKLYVTSPSSSQVTIIRTDTDSVSATVQLPGYVVDLHPSAQVAGGRNNINASHTRGSGTP